MATTRPLAGDDQELTVEGGEVLYDGDDLENIEAPLRLGDPGATPEDFRAQIAEANADLDDEDPDNLAAKHLERVVGNDE